MRRFAVLCALVLLVTTVSAVLAQEKSQTLLEARKGFKTKLTREERDLEALESPPEKLFSIVNYQTPVGEMSAYLGKSPDPDTKHPAIIWIPTGSTSAGTAPGAPWSSSWPRRQTSSGPYSPLARSRIRPSTVRGS